MATAASRERARSVRSSWSLPSTVARVGGLTTSMTDGGSSTRSTRGVVLSSLQDADLLQRLQILQD
jgi:hypothetical protein